MEFRFSSTCGLLLLTACAVCQHDSPANSTNQTDILARCSSANCTNPDQLPKTPVASAPVGPPPFWCPDEYQLLRLSGKWVHACRPQSCSPMKNATRSCKRIAKTLITCPKIALDKGQYEIDDAGRLVDHLHNSSMNLGSYVIDSTKAIVCDPRGNDTSVDPSNRPKLPSWCMPMVVPKGGYSNSSSGRLLVHSINLSVELFTVDPNGTAHVCPHIDPIISEKCGEKRGYLPGEDFEVLPNWDIRHHKNILHNSIYPHGEYILAEDRSFVIICIVPAEPVSNILLYVYGTASLLSAVCLFLALVAHLFFPVLNYHAKALLCLAFSFMVMYIAIVVRYFSGNYESEAANLALFAVHYISSLGAFFWLSILSFDLWRVFADLRGSTIVGDAALKKRIFFAKCAYAWGIPTVLCIVIIALTYSPDAQKMIGLDLHLQTTNWLQDTKTMLIMFYMPIIIVLLENVLFFILTIINLRKASKGTEMINSKVNKKLFQIFLKLFLVMGLCWFFEVISWLTKFKTGEEVWYVTDVINCLQGVLIFLIYVFKKKTLMIIKHKMGYVTTSQMNTTSSSSQGGVKMDTVSLKRMQKKESMHEPCTSSVEARLIHS